ncbi:hypothetical protein E2C01_073770 [Portunus trituberculatus]|uniref:Secreted protein n=1 Tax=Portunus trituberculatus TaxID=210409 RepID=A0A5B7IER7_PORTR|nr:hypothetical protein [Portunus trituberculatus]
MRVSTITLRAWRYLHALSVFLSTQGPPQQCCGCEDSDDATLPSLTRLAMSDDPPHTTPATVMK